MPKAPIVRGKDLIRALSQAGFELVRTKGSHHLLRHRDGRTTVVPVHAGETIGTGLLRKILRDIEMTPEELAALL